MKLNYLAVGNRCAVHLDSLQLPITHQETFVILHNYGFKEIKVDLIGHARECIPISKYRRGARPLEAPETVDCSSLIKWLYSKRGIWLPRRSIQQRELGEPITQDEVVAGDIVFVKGVFDWYYDDPTDGVGHVGIATGEGTIIHASDKEVNVIESPSERFVSVLKFRGIRRLIPKDTTVLTLEIPPSIDVETSDDLRWLVLQTLPA